MNNSLNEKEIRSLVSLIDDNEVYDTVFAKIVDLGEAVIDYLDQELEVSIDVVKNNRLQAAYNQIILNSRIEEIKVWKKHNAINLFQGLTIISRLCYPHLDLAFVNQEINRIKDSLWLELNNNLTALEKVRVLNNIFFDMYGFSGDTKNFFNPKNSYLIDVLKRKKGNPITLSALYSIVAQSIDMPIYGINLPRHFIVAYADSTYSHPYSTIARNNILFYINPFAKGEIYSQKEVLGFLNKLNIKTKDELLLPCSNLVTLKRALNNLVIIYKNNGNKFLENGYKKILDVLEG